MGHRLYKILFFGFFLLCYFGLYGQQNGHVTKLSGSANINISSLLNNQPEQYEITANEFIIGKDSSITWQVVVNQMRDSLQVDTVIASNTPVLQSTILGAIKNRKHIGFNLKMTSAESQDEAVSLPSVADVVIGTRFTFFVRDSSANYDYYLVPDGDLELRIFDRYAEKYYFDATEVAVFILTQNGSEKNWRLESTTSESFNFGQTANNILIADVGTKRLIRGSRVKTNLGSEYEITNVPVSAYNSNAADGYFVHATKDKAPWSSNVIRYSEELNRITYPTGWALPGIDVVVLQDFTADPYGRNTAERIVRTSGNNMWTSTFATQVGEQWTVSFWAKQGVAASNSNAALRINLPKDNSSYSNVSLTTGWVHYTVTQTVVDPFADESFSFVFDGDSGDSIDIWGVQVELGSIATDYKRTELTPSVEGVLYAVYKPSGRGVILDEAYQGSLNDSDFLEKALSFCSTQKVKTVFCERNRRITSKVDMPMHTSIKGTFSGGQVTSVYETSGTIFRLDLNDSGVNAFEFIGGGAGYNSGNSVENIMFLPVSNLGSVIYTESAINSTIKNITIDNIVDATKYITNGINIGSGSLAININDVTIKDCETGILNNGSTIIDISDTDILVCGIAIQSNGMLYMENVWMEDIDSSAVIANVPDGDITIFHCHVENIPDNGSSAPVFDFIEASNVKILYSDLRGNPSAGADQIAIDIKDVRQTEITGNRILHSDYVFKTISTSGTVDVRNNATDIYLPYEIGATNFTNIYDSTKVVSINNSGYSAYKDRRNWIPRIHLLDAYIDNSNIISSNHMGTIGFNSPTIANKNENIVISSEAILNGVSGWSASQLTITTNDTIAADGTTTAEKLAYNTGNTLRFTPTVTLVTDTWYTISFYVANSSFTSVVVDLGDFTTQDKTVTLDNQDEWIRYDVTIQHKNSSNWIDFEFAGGAGKYCHLWGVQVERNRYLGEYIQTTGTPLESDDVNPSLVILESDTLQFKGVIEIGEPNSSADIIINGDAFHNHSHAELYNDKASSIVQTVVANTPEQLLTLTDGFINDFSESGDTLYYTGVHTKRFTVNCSFSWSNNTATTINYLYLYLNDIEVNKFYAEQANVNADDLHAASTSGILELDPGDEITIYIESDTNSDIEIKHINLSITEL